MTKVYKEILPVDNKHVRIEFGWVPTSVIDPQKRNMDRWRRTAYLDDGIVEKRRSDDTKYLSGLEHSEFNAEIAEIIVRYWSLEGATIVDPFAGRVTVPWYLPLLVVPCATMFAGRVGPVVLAAALLRRELRASEAEGRGRSILHG